MWVVAVAATAAIHSTCRSIAASTEHRGGVRTDASRQQARSHSDDVGLLACERQDASGRARDEQPGMWTLYGLRSSVELRDAVVRAVEREGLVGEASLHDRDRFEEAFGALGAVVEGDPDPLVLGSKPARADSPIDAAARHDVERRELLRVHHRMPIVVAGDERTDPDARGRLDRGGEGGDERELVAEMIGYEQRRASRVIDHPAQRAPFVAGRGELARRTEAERLRCRALVQKTKGTCSCGYRDGAKNHDSMA